MLRPFRLLGSALPLAIATAAGAHPGHGETGAGRSLAHHLAEPEHALVAFALLASLGLGCALYARVRASRSKDTTR